VAGSEKARTQNAGEVGWWSTFSSQLEGLAKGRDFRLKLKNWRYKLERVKNGETERKGATPRYARWSQ